MKHYFTIIVFFILAIQAYAQNNLEQTEFPPPQPGTSLQIPDDYIFTIVSVMPKFKGNVNKWLSDNIQYPYSARQNRIEGKVILKFVVEKDGSISNVKVIKGVNKVLDNEALRLIKIMPKWNPGMNNGLAVRTYFTLPVTFKIDNEDS